MNHDHTRALVTLAAVVLMAFQPVPTPTPLMQLAQPQIPADTTSVIQLLSIILPSVLGTGGLLVGLYIYIKRQNADTKAAREATEIASDAAEALVEVNAAQAVIDREQLNTTALKIMQSLASKTVESSDDARISREAAEKAVALTNEMKDEIKQLKEQGEKDRTENSQLRTTIETLQDRIDGLETQIEDLNKKYNERGEEMKAKDVIIEKLRSVIEDKDKTILQKTDELVRYAERMMPPNATMQQPAQPPPAPAAEAPAIKVEVANLNPIEVTETPKGDTS